LGSTDILDVVSAERGFGRVFYERFYLNKPMKVPLPIGGLPDEEVTIAEFIKEHRPNYATAHFGKWHMKGGSPTDHGYDQHDGPTSNAEGNAGEPDPKRIGEVTDRSVRFIREQTAANRPFLLLVSHYAVHTPVLARSETIEKFEATESGTVHSNAAYAAMTEELDGSLESLLSVLDELGISDQTYVIYTSDNGGEIGRGASPTVNTPLAKGKTHTWEGGIRVPLIIRGPGIKAGAQSDVPIIGWDFFPTFAELLQIDASLPKNIDGGSFVEILRNESKGEVTRPGNALVWYYPHYRDMKGVRPQAAIRSGGFKLRKEYETGRLMLFDLNKDIGESADLSSQKPEITKRLHKALEEYLSAVEAKRPVPDPAYDPEKDLGRTGGGFGRRRRP
jgi:arylsulfatase A-like enzyme